MAGRPTRIAIIRRRDSEKLAEAEDIVLDVMRTRKDALLMGAIAKAAEALELMIRRRHIIEKGNSCPPNGKSGRVTKAAAKAAERAAAAAAAGGPAPERPKFKWPDPVAPPKKLDTDADARLQGLRETAGDPPPATPPETTDDIKGISFDEPTVTAGGEGEGGDEDEVDE